MADGGNLGGRGAAFIIQLAPNEKPLGGGGPRLVAVCRRRSSPARAQGIGGYVNGTAVFEDECGQAGSAAEVRAAGRIKSACDPDRARPRRETSTRRDSPINVQTADEERVRATYGAITFQASPCVRGGQLTPYALACPDLALVARTSDRNTTPCPIYTRTCSPTWPRSTPSTATT